MRVLRKLWLLWKAFALRLGQIQTTILLSVVYLLAVGPTALIGRMMRRDPLGLRQSDSPSYWNPLPEVTASVERALKQF